MGNKSRPVHKPEFYPALKMQQDTGGADLANSTSGTIIYTTRSIVQIPETENSLSLREVAKLEGKARTR